MFNTNERYDSKYVERIIAKKWRYLEIPKQVAILYNFFNPKSVLDMGAANGIHTRTFKDFGCYAYGIEGTKHFEKYLKENASDYLIKDIRIEFDLGRKFDLVYCIGVLEHLEEEFASAVIKNIVRHGDAFFIAASPKKSGYHHVNYQPKKYWIDKFLVNTNLIYCEEEVEELQRLFTRKRCLRWLRNSTKIFRKTN